MGFSRVETPPGLASPLQRVLAGAIAGSSPELRAERLARALADAVNAEREACARVADRYADRPDLWAAPAIAAAIRDRHR